MDFLSDLEWRGLLQDISDREGVRALAREHSFYVGYDPSAPSLQIGNLVPITVSLRLAKAGFRAVQLFGGATGAIGDPSGRSAERPLLSRQEITQNIKNHQSTVAAIFERMGVQAEFVDNYDWTKSLNTIDFLRDVGKYFTVNYMLAKEVVKARLEGEGLSFTEFSYMLLQAHDYFHLYNEKSCRLQIGGSDQWGNITAGLELIRKKGLGNAFALSFPLLTDSQGKKFGKSAGGALWLDAAKTSPYLFHQYWLNTPDADVIRYLKVFSFLSQGEIQDIQTEFESAPEKRLAQHVLADHVCDLVHGRQATADAKRSAEVLFGGSIEGIPDHQLREIFKDVPSSEIARSELSTLSLCDLFARTGLTKSKGEARRLIASGGAYLNNNRMIDPDMRLDGPWCAHSELIVLRSGKKSYHLVQVL